MKIAHFQVDDRKASRSGTVMARVVEGLKGVAGVVMVRSMGLLTVLYDEGRIDPVTISDEIVRVEASGDLAGAEPEPDPPKAPAKLRRRRRVPAVTIGAPALHR